MPVTSVVKANSKTAEFARLFDLFDRVASRRARALTRDASTSQAISADDIASVPAEFAPVLRNLSTILSSRAQAASTSTRARHDIESDTLTPFSPTTTESLTLGVDMADPSEDGTKEEHEMPSFPLGERYPFTFKLMLHKLYDLDEWAEKVKHAVETSKSQFKPLAERVQNVVRDATANIKERGEKRSSGRPALGHGTPPKSRPSGATRRSSSVAMPTKPETSRVLKKRCIGRRKSICGPLSSSVWVYDAAVSATEVVGPRSAADTALSKRKDARWYVESRVRHRSLTALEEVQQNAARRQVNSPVPLLEREVIESIPPQPSSVSSVKMAQQIVDTEKKRAW